MTSLRQRTATDPVARQARTPRVRHVLLGGSLALGPVLILAGEAVTPAVDWESNSDVVATAIAEPGRWQAGSMIGLFGWMLLVPAAIAAAQLVRHRKPGLALAIAAFMSAGAMAVVGALMVTYTFVAARAADTEQMVAFFDEAEGLAGFNVLIPVFMAGPVGVLLLAFGLWRTKAIHLWVPVVLATSIVITIIDEGRMVGVLGLALMVVAFLAIAWRYWTTERPVIDVREPMAPATEAAITPATETVTGAPEVIGT
jgi:hypothetical protein